MALIKCPECGKDVSNTINQCIHCGFFLKKQDAPKVTYNPSSIYNVRLESSGNVKLDVIKRIKEYTGIGLAEAKELVDLAPKTINMDLTYDKAQYFADELVKLGATVTLVEKGSGASQTIERPKAEAPKSQTVKKCENCYWLEKAGNFLYPDYYCTHQSNCYYKGIFNKQLAYLKVNLTSSCDLFTPADGGKSNNFKK